MNKLMLNRTGNSYHKFSIDTPPEISNEQNRLYFVKIGYKIKKNLNNLLKFLSPIVTIA